MSNKSFVHLHSHANASMLDGLAQISKLIPAVEEQGMPAIALTDHGSMAATYDLYKATKDSPVKPIYGIEAYVAPGVPRTTKEPVRWNEGGEDDVSGGGAYTHMTLLAETNQGLKNLFKISSESYLTGFYKKPRTDEELFQTFGQGIIATTGCPSGEVQTWLRIGDYQKAKEAAAKYADIFGKENYFVELMDHGLEIERRVIKQLIQIAKELGLQTVATNDLHYVNQSDSHAHEALLCIGSGSKLSDPNRFKFDAQDFYLKSAAEMRHIWDGVDGAELACDNTLLIAERVHADFEHGEDLMPKFPVPEGETEASWLRKEVEKGFQTRYGGHVPQEYRERADYELGIIERMKFPGYFLVVADYINWAKQQGIRVGPARGCLSGDSNVLTPDGIVNIKDIKVGAKVFNQHGEIVEVPAVFKYECSEELIEIKAFYGADGNKMTADHKVLVSKANKTISKHKLAQGIKYEKEILKPEWVRADQVEIGDLVVTPKIKFPIVKEEFTFEPESIAQINIANSNSIRSIASKLGLARSTVMKHYQSEGSAVGPKQEMIRAYLADNSLGIESEIIKRKTITTTKINSLKADYDAGVFFGLFISDGWIRSNGSAEIGFAQNTSEDTGFIPNLIEKLFGLKPTVHISDKRKLTQYVINHKGIKNLLANLFNQYEFNAGSKYIPLELLHTSEDFRKGLLEGLWYGDGSHKGHSKYTTVSKKLANDVMLLLLSLGLPASVKGYKRVEKRQEYNKTGRPFHIEYSVTTAHNFDLNTIIMGKGYDGEYTYYRVREINKVPSEGYVYDFTVPGTNSYVTDSYVVHNSGGGSFVCYLLNITDIDPMQHGLLFERFLNPERVSMPDLDIDFDDRRRGEVIEYVKQKYGEDKVANIATFSTIKAKAAFKDSLRVLGAPYMLGDKLSKAYPPPIVGRDLALSDAYDPSHERYDEAAEFRALVEADPEAQKAIELGLKLEGVKRGFGMHAAGVIMSAEPIVETVPLMKRDTNSPIMTQFEYPTCEYLGLIKMDFLGLSNLGTIDECLRLIKQNRNEEVDLDKIGRDLDDKKTFELLAEGNTIGVFQLDSPPMRALLKLMAPDQFDDISAVLALYRPGPMAMNAHNDYADRKNKRKPVLPIHHELTEPLAPILDETFGIICYQEQVMAIAQKVAGYSLGQADLLRRAMGKKSKEVLDKEYIPFSTGMRENGYSDEAIQTLWEILLPFSDYAFNKSHSAGYGLISYWTAYLKANFPAEYMAALLTTNADNKDKLALYLGECRRMGIKVLPPDVNESELNYTAVGDNIRVGMIGIKGVGEAGVNLWLQERRENGPARSFVDFLERADTSISAKGKVEALILAGAFDCFGVPRSALYSVHEAACEKVRKLKKAKPKNDSIVSLFDSFNEEEMKGLGLEIDFPDIAEWDKKEKLARERTVLGLYVSDHPLSGFVDGLELLSTHSIAYLRDSEHPPTEQVKIAGLVSHVDRKLTKKAAEPWAIVTVEDLDSGMPVMVFPKTYAEVSDLLVPDAILVFTGRVEKRDDGSTTFAVRDVSAPDMAAAQRKAERAKAKALEAGMVDEEGNPVLDKSRTTVAVEAGHQDDGNTSPVMINVHETQMTEGMTERFKELMLDFIGSRPVHLTMTREDGSQVVFALGDQFKVVGTGQFAAEVRALFGPDSV